METDINGSKNNVPAMPAASQIPGQIPAQNQELSPEMQKISELMKELINRNTSLALKVATCECENRDSCKVYKEAQKVAKIIDQMQEIRE